MKKLFIIATALFLSFATLSSTTMAAETRNYTANSENAEIVPFDGDVITKYIDVDTIYVSKYNEFVFFTFEVTYNSRTGQMYSCNLYDYHSTISSPYYSYCYINSKVLRDNGYDMEIAVEKRLLGVKQDRVLVKVRVAP